MYTRTGLLAAVVALLLLSGAANAQTLSNDERFERLERRLAELEQRYDRDIAARDQEIARLRAATQPSATAVATRPADEIDRTRAAVLEDLKSREPTARTIRTPASFNPDLAVITNFKGNVSTFNDNPARNRFDIGSVELDLRAAVDPRADAVVAIPFTREVEDQLFFDPADASGDVDSGVEIEEAYLLLHDFGIPNLTAKVGRFHLRFGRQNLLHEHDWPTVDNNFVNQAFLGPEALTDNGVSLSYVIPPDKVGGHYIEAILEFVSGEGDEEAPVFNNSSFIDSPAINMHLLWNHDLTSAWNLELGGSWMTGKHNDDNQQSANLFGADVTLLHIDPTGGFFNQMFQAEAIHGIVDTSRNDTEYSWGAYALAQQQLNRDWYTGLRLDYTQSATDSGQQVWAVSPYVTWYWSEFLRFRAEYQHRDGDVPSEDMLYFQLTWLFGSHPPHPYWSMK